jgi:hypothetical protein
MLISALPANNHKEGEEEGEQEEREAALHSESRGKNMLHATEGAEVKTCCMPLREQR